MLVGLGAAEVTASTHQLVTNNTQLRGSIGASIDQREAVLDLLANGSLEPVIEEVDFRDLEAAIRRLDQGKVRGRLVHSPLSLTIQKSPPADEAVRSVGTPTSTYWLDIDRRIELTVCQAARFECLAAMTTRCSGIVGQAPRVNVNAVRYSRA